MRVVTPYRPFAPESPSHRRLGEFDWVDAICMLRESAFRACGVEVCAITDVDTALPVPTFHYRTEYRRLMPWIVEVANCYVQSDDFDRDTVMVSPDVLVFGDLSRWFGDYDLGLLARRNPKKPMLNAVQFWPHARRTNLRALYRMVAADVGRLTPKELRWGGDTTPFTRLFGPVWPDTTVRVPGAGIVRYLDSELVMSPMEKEMIGRRHDRLVDFKNDVRKKLMREYYDAVFA